MKNLFLDDLRTIDMVYPGFNPPDWAIARNYHEFVNFIEKFGLPNFISFDHDLGFEHTRWYFENGGHGNPPDPSETVFKEKTGYDAAKWLCEYCQDNGLKIPSYKVHSANPVGKVNIVSYLENFKKRMQ
jgi:hypothetical protein